MNSLPWLLPLLIIMRSRGFVCHTRPFQATYRSFSTAVSADKHGFTVVGGGLAGLSTVFHLLSKVDNGVHVTVVDKAPVGTAGASAVAGG